MNASAASAARLVSPASVLRAWVAIYVNFIVTGDVGKSRQSGMGATSHVARREEY